MKQTTKNILIKSAIASSLLAASAAQAVDLSKLSVNVGLVNVSPDDSSSYLNDVDALLGLPTNSTSLEVDSDTQVAITFDYKIDDNWGLELWTATPFSHEITVKDSSGAVNGLKAGETKQLPPTLLAQYHFGDPSAKLRPFVGAGINITIFFQEEVKSLDSALTNAGKITTDDKLELELDTSIGLALQAGVNYKIDEKWGVHATIAWADIQAEGEVKLNGDKFQEVDVELDPTIFILAASYQF